VLPRTIHDYRSLFGFGAPDVQVILYGGDISVMKVISTALRRSGRSGFMSLILTARQCPFAPTIYEVWTTWGRVRGADHPVPNSRG
jgi:hypothetical protein